MANRRGTWCVRLMAVNREPVELLKGDTSTVSFSIPCSAHSSSPLQHTLYFEPSLRTPLVTL